MSVKIDNDRSTLKAVIMNLEIDLLAIRENTESFLDIGGCLRAREAGHAIVTRLCM